MTAVTFDVDFTDYTSADGEMLDEMDASFNLIQDRLKRWPQLKTTWFVRIDRQIAARYGRPDHIVRKHLRSLEWLRANGHEIGWHHHAFESKDGHWRPSSDAATVSSQLREMSGVAQANAMSASRMGWGFHRNETMATLDELGWRVDSTAMPRPSYAWDSVTRDWSTTPQHPYRPSVSDYRVPDEPMRALVEVPITMVPITTSQDTQPDVLRYLNPAYHPDVFAAALARVEVGAEPVMVCHPYEILPSRASHPLIAFDPAALTTNLELLVAQGDALSTISEIAARPTHTRTSIHR